MAKEICISSTPHETRLAILEDDQLAEIYYERENEYTLAGSIYNGKVTRVLPGMQSAFVDIGLERDAFLYVTDFLELEDQEDADELEKAAVAGGNQPPREVRQREPERGGRQNQRQEPRAERPPVAQLAAPVEESEEFEAAEPVVAEGDATQDDAGSPKRWRGRRRRRSGRSGAQPQEGSAELTEQPQAESGEFEVEELEAAPAAAPATIIIEDSYDESATEGEAEPEAESYRAPRRDRDRDRGRGRDRDRGRGRDRDRERPRERVDAAEPFPEVVTGDVAAFVLPGEQLRKYGGTPVEDETPDAAAASAVPARPMNQYKPATLIESPIEWDGSGLLPGESLSRHGGRPAEPAAEAVVVPMIETTVEVVAEPEAEVAVEAVAPAPVEPQVVQEEIVETVAELEPIAELAAAAEAAAPQVIEEEFAEEELVEEEVLSSPAPQAEAELEEEELTQEPEGDASASHHVDPAAPQGFRILDLFKKGASSKEEAAPEQARVEVELVEEESFAAPAGQRGPRRPRGDRRNENRTETRGENRNENKNNVRNLDKVDDEGLEQQLMGRPVDDDEDEDEATGQTPSGDRRPREGRGRERRSGRDGQRPGKNGRAPSRRSMQSTDLPAITELLKPGQEILVQIAKEPIAKKGARITSHIALPGRFLVFMPTVSHVGVSRKIASDEERQRLKRILIHERGEASGGFIVRTAAEGASEEELRADLRFLLHLWDEIKNRSENSKSPALIYHDLSLIERILRDQVSSDFANIWVDSEADYERIVRFLNRFSPDLVRRVKLYTKETPLFEHFGIQDEISKALRSKVWLKSGGSIVINQTEALVAIDINTGKYVGKSARLEDTILKTNLDAVPEIVRQIRLRDLGGIIVIDFIDMDERKNRFKVMAALEEALKTDRAPTKVLQFNDFGLVAITRKRVKQSLERTLSVPCPTCQATGMVKSPATVCNEIWTEMRKMRKHFESADVMLRVHPETVKVLKSGNGRWLTELEELVGKNILIKTDPALHPEQFDIQG